MLKEIKAVNNGRLMSDETNQYWFITHDIGKNYSNVPPCVALHRVIVVPNDPQ